MVRGGRFYIAFRGLLLRIFMLYTFLEYWRLARQVVSQIADYERSGFEVIGNRRGWRVTVVRRPHRRLDVRRSFEAIASTPLADSSIARRSTATP